MGQVIFNPSGGIMPSQTDVQCPRLVAETHKCIRQYVGELRIRHFYDVGVGIGPQ